jgi:hypothetical protein
MFGFGRKSREAAELATRLAATANHLRTYLPLSNQAFVAAVQRDFPGQRHSSDGREAFVAMRDMPAIAFHFSFVSNERQLSAMGRGPLAGFMLWLSSDGKISVSAADLAITPCSDEAKRLKRAMVTRAGASDVDAVLKRRR